VVGRRGEGFCFGGRWSGGNETRGKDGGVMIEVGKGKGKKMKLN